MTAVADTRFLIVHTFPSTEVERDSIRGLMHRCLRERLIIPTVVLTEYLRIAGKKIGRQRATARILQLRESGAEFIPLDEKTAFLAGNMLLENREKPIGDAIIAATLVGKGASYVISDDPDFEDFGVTTRWI